MFGRKPRWERERDARWAAESRAREWRERTAREARERAAAKQEADRQTHLRSIGVPPAGLSLEERAQWILDWRKDQDEKRAAAEAVKLKADQEKFARESSEIIRVLLKHDVPPWRVIMCDEIKHEIPPDEPPHPIHFRTRYTYENFEEVPGGGWWLSATRDDYEGSVVNFYLIKEGYVVAFAPRSIPVEQIPGMYRESGFSGLLVLRADVQYRRQVWPGYFDIDSTVAGMIGRKK